MSNDLVISYLQSNGILYETDVNLKKKTWIHRGGMAYIFISPENSEELKNIVSFLYKNDISFKLIGHTSNLYISNECNIPVVVSTYKCRNYNLKDNYLYCEAGVGVINLSKQMINNGVRGFEYLTGLPGTIGGALVNNSSCKENSIANLLINAQVVLRDGTIKTMESADFKFEFRDSVFKRQDLEGTIVSATLKAEPGDKVTMQSIAEHNNHDRERRLEGNAKNLGCTVNSCFINGRMSIWLRLLLFVYRIFALFFIKDENKERCYRRDLICFITGYKSIARYISAKNPIIFMWLDDGADTAFPLYLEFMRKVYKTDKVEIEIIR